MAIFWTLLVETREQRDQVVVEMALLDQERRWQWRKGCTLDGQRIEHIRRLVQRSFAPRPVADEHEPSRGDLMRALGSVIASDLNLRAFLDASRLDQHSFLVVSTTATSIPWDLILFRNDFLACGPSLAISIPIANAGWFTSAENGRGAMHGQHRKSAGTFLHVVANADGDLQHLEGEKKELAEIVARCPGISYRLLENPDSQAILDEFIKPGLRYFHYSGHISPRRGLRIGSRKMPQILGLSTIESRFRGDSEPVVFLNGCDAYLGEPEPGHLTGEDADEGPADLFVTATVANAFLYAGAGAVVAPRSRIADDEAAAAAPSIWRSFLIRNVPLGAAVRDFRRDSIASSPNSLGGYSYVLYGNPSSLSASISSDPAVEQLRNHEVIREAAAEAAGPMGPRHIFAALTRRWTLGAVFFASFGQEYVGQLTQLRQHLQARQIPPAPVPPVAVEFGDEGEFFVRKIIGEPAPPRQITELALAAAVCASGDPEITAAIVKLDIPGLDFARVCERCRQGAPGQAARALFLPSGWANPKVLVPAIYVPDQAHTGQYDEESISPWDLFTAIAAGAGAIRQFLLDQCLPGPPAGTWHARRPLHWCWLAAATRRVLMVASGEMRDEAVGITSESHLVYALHRTGAFDWDRLPADACEWIGDRVRWEAVVGKLMMRRYEWPND